MGIIAYSPESGSKMEENEEAKDKFLNLNLLLLFLRFIFHFSNYLQI